MKVFTPWSKKCDKEQNFVYHKLVFYFPKVKVIEGEFVLLYHV